MVMSVKRLWLDQIPAKVLKAFPYEDKTRIDTFEVMNAIGSYIRAGNTYGIFDEYMRGDKSK
jgi:cytochrome c peroxidase